MSSQKIFIIKKDKYLGLDLSLNIITFENTSYSITDIKKIGSRITMYTCETGILEISNSPKKLSKWNGVSIMTREDISILPHWIPKKTSDTKRRFSRQTKNSKKTDGKEASKKEK